MTEHILTESGEGVLEIAINRPAKKNAITGAMYTAMIAALAAASSDPDVRVVLISGCGGAFSAGNDLEDFLSGPEGGKPAFDFIRVLEAFDKPIVAAVQGLAVGIGTTMLFHCDLVYAAPDARFIMPFVNLGLVPEAGSSLLAPLRFGHAKAAALLLLGEPLGATAAESGGLVTALVPAEGLLDHARAKARALAAKPAAAVAMTRRLMKLPVNAVADRIEAESQLFAEALTSEDAREAFTAFFEKRPADFARR